MTQCHSTTKAEFWAVAGIGILIALGSSPVVSQETTPWLVPTEKIACVVEHIAVYKAQQTDPVIIYLDACPETDTVKVFERLARNAGVPELPRNPNTTDGKTESVIVLTKTELDCLAGLELPEDRSTFLLPRRPCE